LRPLSPQDISWDTLVGKYPEMFSRGPRGPRFSQCYSIKGLHWEYLSEDYFTPVGSYTRFPRYKNRKEIDPYVKMYMDDNNLVMGNEYMLPKPNPEASFKSLAKYAKADKYMQEEEIASMNDAFYHTYTIWEPYMAGSKIKSYEEVVPLLDLSTSPGVPYSSTIFLKRDFPFDDFKAFFEKDWVNMSKPHNWYCLWASCLKEELRTILKVRMNSIRTFMSSGVDGTLAGMRLFDDMNQKFINSHSVTPSEVGSSPFHNGWDALHHKLSKHPNVFELDESQYDSSIRRYMLGGCASIRFRLLRPEDQTPENRVRIQNFYNNVIHSFVMTDEGIIVRKKTGMPSGTVNTISDNTLVLHTFLTYAWLRIVPHTNVDNVLRKFVKHVQLALVGDDNTWSVSDKYVDIYNAVTVGACLSKIGITCTTPCATPRKANEVSFLSTSFTQYRGVYVPLYDWRKLLTSLCYSEYSKQSPIYTLERLNGLAVVGWSNPSFWQLCCEIRQYMIQRFDKLYRDNTDWVMVKRAWLDYLGCESLYIGLEKQSLGRLERSLSQGNRLSMKTKQQFLNSPKRRNLPPREKERRWKQYAASQRSTAANKRRGYTRNTRMKTSGRNLKISMSPCAKHYLTTLVAPFEHKGVACVPDLHAVPSKKIRVKTRGTFSSGVNGYGWIIVNPWCNSSDFAVASHSISSYAGAALVGDPAVLPAGVTNTTPSKIPYASAAFGANLRARTVGVGLRIRYIGPELARSGQIIGLRKPDNTSCVGSAPAALRTYEEAKTFSNKKQWMYALYRPVEPEDYEFSPFGGANAGGTVAYPIVFWVGDTTNSGGTPGPAPFEFEIIQYIEYIGDIDNVTASHVDVSGMAHIRNSLPVKSVTDNMGAMVRNVTGKISRSINANLPQIIKTAAPAIGGAMAYKTFGGEALAPEVESSYPLIEEIEEGALEFGEMATEFAPLLLL